MQLIKKSLMIYLISLIFSSTNAHPIIFHQKIDHVHYIDLFFVLLICVFFILVILNSGKIKHDEKKY